MGSPLQARCQPGASSLWPGLSACLEAGETRGMKPQREPNAGPLVDNSVVVQSSPANIEYSVRHGDPVVLDTKRNCRTTIGPLDVDYCRVGIPRICDKLDKGDGPIGHDRTSVPPKEPLLEQRPLATTLCCRSHGHLRWSPRKRSLHRRSEASPQPYWCPRQAVACIARPVCALPSSCCPWPNVPSDRDGAFLPGLGQIMHRLKVHPEFRAGAEEASQPQGSVRCHRPLALDDRAHARRRHTKGHRQRIHRKPERLQYSSASTSPGWVVIRLGVVTVMMPCGLVVVDALDIFGSLFRPDDANAPLKTHENRAASEPCWPAGRIDDFATERGRDATARNPAVSKE